MCDYKQYVGGVFCERGTRTVTCSARAWYLSMGLRFRLRIAKVRVRMVEDGSVFGRVTNINFFCGYEHGSFVCVLFIAVFLQGLLTLIACMRYCGFVSAPITLFSLM